MPTRARPEDKNGGVRTPVILTCLLLSLATACTGTTPAPPVAETTPASAAPEHPTYAEVQAALGARAKALTTLLENPVGKRDWGSVSEGYLPTVERYEDLRLARFEKEKAAPRQEFGTESLLAWSPDDKTVLVSESEAGGASYELAAYSWRGGKPRQVFRLPADGLGRFQSEAGASLTPADASILKQLVTYRSTGKLPKGVTVDKELFATFKNSANVDDIKHFTHKTGCAVVGDDSGQLAWQLPISGGTLTLAAVLCRSTSTGKGGWQLSHNQWDIAITKDKRYYSRMVCETAFPMSVFVAANGKVTWASPLIQPTRVCEAR